MSAWVGYKKTRPARRLKIWSGVFAQNQCAASRGRLLTLPLCASATKLCTNLTKTVRSWPGL